jgi:DNA-binding NarL/FixJ family response regulator
VLVIDGRPLVRSGLAHVVGTHADLLAVSQVSHADHARDAVLATNPNVVTIDCSLPEGQGWKLARDLRDRYPELGIVLLSADTSDDLLFRALDSGASAYLSNDASLQEVVGAIRLAAAAASTFSAAGLAQALRRRHDAPTSPMLSPREAQVLALLRDGQSVPAVAATLYVSLSTAKTYVARLYEKLGAGNRAQALMAAVQLGLFADHHG